MYFQRSAGFDNSRKYYFGSRESYMYYRRYVNSRKLPKTEKIADRDLFYNIVEYFWKRVGEDLVENIGGVYLNNIGYFYVWRLPPNLKRIYTPNVPQIYLYHTNHKILSFTFIPTHTKRYMHVYSMDNKFTKPLVNKLSKNILKGYRYRNYMHSHRLLHRKRL